MSGRPLSFCMVTTFYPPHHFGGDAIYVHRLADALARRGHRVTVVSTPDAHSLLGGRPGVAPEQHPNVALEPLEPRLGALSPLVTYLTGRPGLRARRLREVFRREPFDVVHFHNVSLVGGPGVLAYGGGIKLYTTHEHWLVCPMHTLWKSDREPCERPTCLRCTFAFRRPPQLWRYTGLLEREVRHVDLFLAPSRFTIEAHRARGFTGPLRRLPLFLPHPPPAAAAPAAERPYFLFVGRLEKAKGVQTLIDRFRSYDAADLVVVGEGRHGQELRAQAHGLPHVRFTGFLPFDELDGLYAGAVALLVPSVGYETFGLTTVEAFARRTPAVVRDLGGLPEAIEESGGGFTYRTEAELLEAMEALRTRPSLRAELGERGHRAFLERWSEEPHLAAYLGLIEEVAAARGLRSGAGSNREGAR